MYSYVTVDICYLSVVQFLGTQLAKTLVVACQINALLETDFTDNNLNN